MLDTTITLGNILTIISMVVSVGVMIVTVLWRVARVEMRLELVWRWFERMHKMNGKDS